MEKYTISIVQKFGRFICSAHLVEHHSEGPHVDLWSDQCVLTLYLRCYVSSSTTLFHHESFPVKFRFHNVRQTEIAKLYYWKLSSLSVIGVRSLEQCILYLHITMHYS